MLTELTDVQHFNREAIERSMLHDGYISYGGIACCDDKVEGGGWCGAVLRDRGWIKDCSVVGG